MAPKKKKKKNLQKKTKQLNNLLHFGTVREREKRLKRAPEPLKIDETLELSKWEEEEEEERVAGWDEKYVV